MKKIVLISSSLIIPFLFLTSKTHASVTNDVHVSTSGGNANSNVVINNSGGTNSTSSYTTGGTTNIHVESNGQSYDYHSDKPGSVNVQNNNGKVTVNGQQQTTTPTTPKASMSAEEMSKAAKEHAEAFIKKVASDAARMQKHKEEVEKSRRNIFQKLIDSLKNLFHLG